MQRNLIKYLLLFFTPLIIGLIVIELISRNLTNEFKVKQTSIALHQEDIETIVTGSSQMKRSINPEESDSYTLNIASSGQHHDTDFKLLKQLAPQFKNLKTVVLEVSYSHFELPHNGNYFWKNPLYLYYYKVNLFNHTPYLKDRILFLTRPSLFISNIKQNYYIKNPELNVNEFGYLFNGYDGMFKKLNYDVSKINNVKEIDINSVKDDFIFKNNTNYFFEMLDYLSNRKLNIIICNVPMYKTYLENRNPIILKRRDSILKVISIKYPSVHFLNKEEDTINFEVTDYINHSHLNPKGAKKFTKNLSDIINQLDKK